MTDIYMHVNNVSRFSSSTTMQFVRKAIATGRERDYAKEARSEKL